MEETEGWGGRMPNMHHGRTGFSTGPQHGAPAGGPSAPSAVDPTPPVARRLQPTAMGTNAAPPAKPTPDRTRHAPSVVPYAGTGPSIAPLAGRAQAREHGSRPQAPARGRLLRGCLASSEVRPATQVGARVACRHASSRCSRHMSPAASQMMFWLSRLMFCAWGKTPSSSDIHTI